MKAILVKHLPCTETLPARYKAIAEGVPPIVASVTSLGTNQPAYAIARLLCHKYGWSIDLAGGELPNGDEVFCFRKQGRPHV